LLTPGILYDISRFVAWENINVIDIILTKTELSIIIDKKDLMRCYKVLGRFAENSKDSFVLRYNDNNNKPKYNKD
jgi:hypothetical protein